MGSRSAEFILLTIVVLIVAYLIVTPIANKTASLMGKQAELIESRGQIVVD